MKGQGKTYYHVKDINFLAHEPLLDKFRALRAYERKIKKAKAKKAYHAVDRLEERKPQYGLDHLVKERYPSFGDALRDFDDPLTLTHLFAMLPADKRHGIPAELVTRARSLALEFQAYVTKTKSLRKVFISVKGIYYQALVHGVEVTWLTPHALAQTLPEDVDYRVMLTFLEFYLAMMGFVNYKLYHDRALRYPPLLDTRLEDNAAGIVAVIHDLADTVSQVRKGQVVTAAKRGDAQATATEARMKTLDFDAIAGGGDEDLDDEEAEAEKASRAARRDGDDDGDEDDDDDEKQHADDDDEAMEDVIASAAGLDPAQREDAKTCASLFKGLVFFLNREVPRDAMVFIIRAFGGEVCWEGEGSPYDEKDGGVTHHVCDRPISKDAMKPQREYVQPQWVADCANWRVLIPTKEYAPGAPPPPHLSPFVDAEDEGYTPDYQQTLMRLKAQAKAAREGRTLLDDDGDQPARMLTETEEASLEEKQYARDLQNEARGVPYSRSKEGDGSGSSDEESDGEEDVELEGDANDSEDSEEEEEEENSDSDDDAGVKTKKRKAKASTLTPEMAMREKDVVVNKRIKSMGEEEEMDAMRHVMLPRKKRELYRAMQLGLAKKEARADELRKRKEALKAAGEYGRAKEETAAKKPAAKKAAKKKK